MRLNAVFTARSIFPSLSRAYTWQTTVYAGKYSFFLYSSEPDGLTIIPIFASKVLLDLNCEMLTEN
jgi:hypothetical protein